MNRETRLEKLIFWARKLVVIAPLAITLSLQAQTFPDKPLSLVVGFPPGGATDSAMRTVAEELAKALGQAVVIDNRAGAGGAIATQYVVGARPDGYTLLTAGLQLATGLHLNKVAYNPLQDLTMVGQLGNVPVLLLVKGDSKIQSAADLAALAVSRGDGITVGTGGVGTTGHFGSLMLGTALKVTTVHVPFKGGAPGLQALASGDVDVMFDQMSGAMLGLIQAGKVRVVAVMQNTRMTTLPHVKSAAEFGLVLDAPLQGWTGLAVYSGTPAPVVQKLRAAWMTAVDSAAVKAKVDQLGIDLDTRKSPEDFQRFYLGELARWGAFIKKNQITAQ